MSSQKSFTPFSLFKAKTFSTITSLRLKNKQFADFIQKVFYKGKKRIKKNKLFYLNMSGRIVQCGGAFIGKTTCLSSIRFNRQKGTSL